MTERAHFYILNGHEAVPCSGKDWADWFAKADRTVARTRVRDLEVSTVFLGLDHSFRADEPPVLFETMIFGLDNDEPQWRYSTWSEAEAHHNEVVGRLRQIEREARGHEEI